MGIYIGIGNYIGNKRVKWGIHKDPTNIFYNILTEEGTNILTEDLNLILRDLNNISSESSLILITEDNKVIMLE